MSSYHRILCPTLKSCAEGKFKEAWSENLERLCAQAQEQLKNHSITCENAVLTQTCLQSFLPSSLDNNGQFSPTSSHPNSVNSWSKKQKRAYHCAISGLKRCKMLGYKAFFLTLTSSPKTNHQDLRKDWDILVKRIRKLFPKFQYVKVETFEGYGVIHALYHHAFDGWDYKSIHQWISQAWSEIHQAPIVRNSVVGESWSIKKVAGYLCQYMSSQKGFFRRSTSLKWIFAGYRKKWVNLIQEHGFKKALFIWNFILSIADCMVRSTEMHLVDFNKG
jgi:hypothetical protein